MCDMGGLENLVANTAYLKAQAGLDKDMRRRRRSQALPKPEQCTAARFCVGADFDFLCVRQPIGRTFFRRFLEQSAAPEYAAAAEFLEELAYWDLAEEDGTKDEAQQNIINRFCKPDSDSFLSFLTGELAERCQAVTARNFQEIMKCQVRDATKEFLRGKPFTEYQNSPYFDKFLQWKQFEKQPISERYFYEFRTLGKGGFGEVCAVQVKCTGQMYACKKLDKRRLKSKGGERLALLEKQILEKVNSPFLVNLAYAYDTPVHLCLVMTLMTGGDLKYHIYDMGERGIDPERIVYYTAQITCGLLHLHSMDIVYRDMKPENVLLDSRGQCRLSDLGLAVQLRQEVAINQKAGTSGYMAPELLRQDPYSMSVDWWALGCSIYEMVAGRLPFKDFKEKVQKDEVTRRTFEDDVKFTHRNFDAPTRSIIEQLLKKKVSRRLGSKESGEDPRKHEWFKSINFPRLEAGLMEPPWTPRPNVVYAKDTGDIRDFSEVRGVQLDAADHKFYKEFSTGAVSIPFQQEMMDSGLFEELNDPSRVEPIPLTGDEKKSKSCVLS
ncbi:rhodopsin kinase grk7-b [Engraulis encrasicolus]|uniref:rhodopsin kinase grk7-b n=1 Tax=Engraulis encrasicolus TaxID=184585 RepID=UPI002FD11734